jgi:hypothetical protein
VPSVLSFQRKIRKNLRAPFTKFGSSACGTTQHPSERHTEKPHRSFFDFFFKINFPSLSREITSSTQIALCDL